MRTFLLLLIALATTGLSPVYSAEEDGPAARAKVTAAAAAFFKKGDWAAIEKEASALRTAKARFPEGLWKLPIFYSGLYPATRLRTEKEWQDTLAKYDEWKAAFPESITARVAYASALTEYAWFARGSGWAREVTDEGWERFGERLAQARTVLEGADRLPEKCPVWFSTMQTIALGQSWERAEYEALYRRAIAFDPTFYDFYFRKANNLLPRWGGEEGEWQRYAEQAAKTDAAAEGLGIYTRICWYLSGYSKNIFEEDHVDWAKMRQGFLDMEKQFPDSPWNLNWFAKFAVQAGDRATALDLLARIGDKPAPGAWGTAGQLEVARRWARGEEGPKARAVLAPEETSPVNSLAFSPDGNSLAAGYNDGRVILWNMTTLKPGWSPVTGDVGTMAVAFSPDGKLLAASSGNEEQTAAVGNVTVWDVARHGTRRTIDDWAGPVYDLAFSRDGSKLVMVGGLYDKRGESQVWNVGPDTVEKETWDPPHTHAFKAVALSEDGRVRVCECNRSISVFDTVDRKPLFDTKQNLNGWVRKVVFSPDGKLLVAGTMHSWRDREKPDSIVLWDVPEWKQRPQVIKTSGVFGLSFSPDGRHLASGGYDTILRIWDLATGKESAGYLGHTDRISAVVYSPDGRTLASAGRDGTIRLWDVAPKATAAN